jgi:hypothetical protein
VSELLENREKMVKRVRTYEVFEIDKSIEDELEKLGYWYLVEWTQKGRPNGLKWRNSIDQRDVDESEVVREICFMLGLNSRKVNNLKFNMGVRYNDETETYNQFLNSITFEIITRWEV